MGLHVLVLSVIGAAVVGLIAVFRMRADLKNGGGRNSPRLVMIYNSPSIARIWNGQRVTVVDSGVPSPSASVSI